MVYWKIGFIVVLPSFPLLSPLFPSFSTFDLILGYISQGAQIMSSASQTSSMTLSTLVLLLNRVMLKSRPVLRLLGKCAVACTINNTFWIRLV